MTTIIDSLLIELGLDISKLTKGQKDATDSLRKLEDGSNTAAKNIEGHGKKMGKAIYEVRNQVVGLMTAFTAGVGLKEFFQQMTRSDSAAGRLATNLGMSVEQLTAWQGVAARAGGSAEGIAGSMQNLTQQFQQLALTGQSAVIPYFRAVGVAIADSQGKMRPLGDVLLDLSDKFSQMDPSKAQALGRGMGIDEGTINVLIQGRVAVTDLLREQERLGHTNAADAKAAQERTRVLVGLGQAFADVGRKILTLATPALITFTNVLGRVAEWFHDHPQAAAVTMGILTAAVVALSVALSVGAVAALGSFAVAGAAAFAGLAIAAAPFLLAIAAISAGIYGISKALDWVKSRKGFAEGDFSKSDAWSPVDPKAPRGIRNNNPGNLNYAGQEGATKEGGPNGRFAVFKTMQDGIIALAKQLKLYASRGIDTISEIISKYAPAGENNTKAYIDAISKKLGVGANATLDLNNNETLRALIEGISTVEVGKGRVSMEQINAALSARNSAGARGASNTAHSETHINEVNIHTQSTDAKGIMRDLGKTTDKYSMAAMANYGLA